MAATPTRKREFQKRVRLTKEQERQIFRRRNEFPHATYNTLTAWARERFNLFKTPSKQVIARVLRGGSSLHPLTPDCLSRKKRCPLYQLDLDQCIVEFDTECAAIQFLLTDRMIIAQARKFVLRLGIPVSSQHRLSYSWLRNLQMRYGIRWRRAYGV